MHRAFNPSRPLSTILVALLFLAIFLQLAFLSTRNSATWDEPDHIYAGYMQWKHADFGLNAEHPPMIKFLATLPLLGMQLHEPPLLNRPYRLQEAAGGEQFVFQNDADAILLRARLAASSITFLLAVLIFAATREMFGGGAALIALGLIAFDPTLLAHSGLVTTDVGGACFMLWAIYAYYRYLKSPTLPRLIVVGLVVGLALSAKHSAVLLFPMLFLLAALERAFPRQVSSPYQVSAAALASRPPTGPAARPSVARLALGLLAIILISITVLWSWYGFRYAARQPGFPLNPGMPAQLLNVPSPFQAKVLALFDHFHLFPQSYLYGFAHVLFSSRFLTSYLLGTTYPHSVWFYFPIAMLIKSSLTFLLLLAVALWAVATGRFRKAREVATMTVPAAVYMLFAMAGGMNIGVRHVLPVYVFLSVPIAGASWALILRNRLWLYAAISLIVFQAASVLHAFPNYIAYANEAFGGPANVHKYLSDSSADWGQQLKAVRQYLGSHRVQQCWFAYFGQGVADPAYYGIPCRPLVTAASLYFDSPRDIPPAIDGPILMSAGVLSGFEFGPGALNPYVQFQTLSPAAVIDNSVFVFEGHFDIPLAAALSHSQKAGLLLQDNHAAAAIDEARQAQALAPTSATVNLTLARALDAGGQPGQAVPYYQKALILAQTVSPAFQVGTVAAAQQRLAAAK